MTNDGEPWRVYLRFPKWIEAGVRRYADENGLKINEAVRSLIARQLKYVERNYNMTRRWPSDSWLLGQAEKAIRDNPKYTKSGIALIVSKAIGRGFQDPSRITWAVDTAWAAKKE